MNNIPKQPYISFKPNYKKLFTKAPVLVSKEFSIWVSPNSTVDTLSFGVIVLKKHIKSAVARNKAKRIAKALFKEYKTWFTHYDLVLVIKNFALKSNLGIWCKKLIGVYSWLGHFILNV